MQGSVYISLQKVSGKHLEKIGVRHHYILLRKRFFANLYFSIVLTIIYQPCTFFNLRKFIFYRLPD